MNNNEHDNKPFVEPTSETNKSEELGTTGSQNSGRRRRKEKKSLTETVKTTAGSVKEKAKNIKPKNVWEWIKLNKKKILIYTAGAIMACIIAVIIYAGVIILSLPKVDPNDLYSLLPESSTLYDDSGTVIETVYSESNRSNITFDQLPQNMVNAMIALEDKTFYDHNGFNYIRMVGAVVESVFGGGQVGGTSTLTQQLARNLYLQDSQFDRTIRRKIAEAYYAVQLERHLSKEEIMEAYMNTVFFGYNSYGIQIASTSYFSKDVSELTLVEAATLAALPQMPSTYALVELVSNTSVTEETTNIIHRTENGTYLYNESGIERRNLCLYLMKEQGMISEEEYEETITIPLTDYLNPTYSMNHHSTSYFTDYVIEQVIDDLQAELGVSAGEAFDMVHNDGYQIHTTLDSQAQNVLEVEFADPSNFPSISYYRTNSEGNILNSYNSVILYDYANYFNSEGIFTFKSDEVTLNEDGSLTIISGKRLRIYDTVVGGEADYSIEFKELFLEDEDTFFTIKGGYLNIPQTYKSRDADDNLLVSAEFFKDYPNFFTISEDNVVSFGPNSYTLNAKTIQPQSAMTIVENETGHVKGMIGGRDAYGRYLYNRATNTNNPGSSMKPLAVYAPALQHSYEAVTAGSEAIALTPIGQQGTTLYGEFITAGSIIDDEPLTFTGSTWPKNFYSGYRGLHTLRDAIVISINTSAVKIMSQIGADYGFEMVEKFGITTLSDEDGSSDRNLSLGLGGMTNGVKPIEMATAYSTFPNGGYNYEAKGYTQVLNKEGELIIESTSPKHEVLDPGVAYIMTDILLDVPPYTLSGLRYGGKTGTTDEHHDYWYCGFTPTYSAALWIGSDYNMTQNNSSASGTQLWHTVMNQVVDAKKGSYKSNPGNVVSAVVDSPSGPYTELFIAGTVPQEKPENQVSVTATMCTHSHFLATPHCVDLYEKAGIRRPYIPNSSVRDAKTELTHYYCNLHNTDVATYPIDPTETLVPFEPAVYYDIVFDADGGFGEMESVSIKENNSYILPPCTFTPPDSTMQFKEWLIIEDNSLQAPGSYYPITGNITIQAVWEIIPPVTP